MEIGNVHRATIVTSGLMTIIMTKTPMIVMTDVRACVMPSCKVVEMRSMSLTTRERISPFACES